MPTCAACGWGNPDNARFCSGCGSPLVARPGREERKIVTVLFADLVGFSSRADRRDPEDIRALLAGYHARVREELERRGGTVEKFIGDAVMALFGAPVAREDDPERAVRAAFAIRDALAELNDADPSLELQLRIGLDTGEALVALGARPASGEPMASGDVVITAARLQAAAEPNGILVGETTYRATDRVIEYGSAGAVAAKGKAEPVPVWEALAPRARLGVDVELRARAPFVGRRDELDLLVEALGRVRRERSPQLVTIVGVPGIGKTRLVWELRLLIDGEAELTYWRQGRSLPSGEGSTFGAIGEMVKAQAGILETDTAESAGEKLRLAVADLVHDAHEAQWVESFLRPLVGLGGEEASGDRGGEAFAAWSRFFEGMAEQSPTVLVFDGLHWADNGMLDFVDGLVDRARGLPLLVVGMARPELLDRWPGWGGGKRNATTVSLVPLSGPETDVLLDALLEGLQLAGSARSALVARTGGIPLYAEEYARMVRDRPGQELLPLPESVQGIIAARIDALDDEDKLLLQDAAVVGKVFWVGALVAGAETERQEVHERLQALERREFVRRARRSSVAGETEYVFDHALVRDVAYGQIPRADRSRKHRGAAEWIGTLAADRVEDHAELLAHHYLQALEFARAAGEDEEGLVASAVAALRDAGERAFALGAFPAAVRFFEHALGLVPADYPERSLLLFRLVESQQPTGEVDEALMGEARETLIAAGDVEHAAEVEIFLGWRFWHQARRGEALQHHTRAVGLVEKVPPSRSKATVFAQAAISLMVLGQNPHAIAVGRDALAVAEELDLADLRASALNTIGSARVSDGDLEGLADIERAIAIAEEINSPESIRAYRNLASMLLDLGDLEGAFREQAKGRAAAERFGFAMDQRWFAAELVHEQYARGLWAEALAGAEAFIEASRAAPHYLEVMARQKRALIRLASGDEASALEDVEWMLEYARGVKDTQLLLPTLATHARVSAWAGRSGEATSLLDEFARVWDRTITAVHLWGLDVGCTARELGRTEEFARLLGSVTIETPWLDAARAYLAGDYATAADRYAALGSAPDEADARHAAAGSLLAAGERGPAEAQLERALELYRSLGAGAYATRAEQALAAR